VPFSEAVRVAVASLRSNKLRSFLTVLGILIGVSSVIAVVAIIDGLDGYIANRVLQLGTKSFSVQKMPNVITSFQEFVEMNKRKDISMEDLRAVAGICDACAEVGGQLATARTAKWGRTVQESVQVMGITENVPRIGSVRELVTGRHLIQEDIDEARYVGVIGTDLVTAFFGQMEPLGKTILFDGNPIRVVGVAEKKGSCTAGAARW
jgi:putative ABC transport system permease protein